MRTSPRTPAGLVIGRLCRHSLRRPGVAYVIPIVMPLGLIIFISQLYGALVSRPAYPVDDLLSWMGPGVVFLAATMGGGFTASLMVVDAESGFLDRLRLLAVRPSTLVVACLVFEGLRMVPVAGALLAVSALMGLTLPGAAGLAAVVALAALWAAAWNAAFMVATLRSFDPQLPQTLLPLFLPFFLASTIMVPAALLPEYLRWLAEWNPLDRFVVAVRPWFLGTPVDVTALTNAMGAAATLLAVLGALSLRQLSVRRMD